ncbi:M20 family metallo-hydrolase [Luteolibacter ambystomatis]|uniref:M20 family metallo-hydrolase n=1 Tax=Luteolibacter ambystomatis TaxID=2824561 RepID=A0A975J2Q7_9BACT|nr:M20 family metallo-hydrolase [Luteolibacter ambystomatis]QUE52934.1 M20 family metallo-hydrolase [Luteolibacter ambystomatis]
MSELADHTLRLTLDRIKELGAISEEKGRLTRTLLSSANKAAAGRLLEWMRELNMQVSHNAMGTVRGVLPGTQPRALPLLIGSHFDTAVGAGKYDGVLGILVGLAALERLAAEGIALPVPVHLLGFADQEGVRFHTSYLGSRWVCGDFDEATYALRDDTGITLSTYLALAGWTEDSSDIEYPPGGARGYLEVHIEQGRILEQAGQPAGVVTAICGQSRVVVSVLGKAEHAATTPMDLRHDALTGAAECLLAIEKTGRDHPPLLASVGKIQVEPGTSGSIPGVARFTLDLRHPEDAVRAEFLEKLRARCSAIVTQRGLKLEWRVVLDHDGVSCDVELGRRLTGALTAAIGSAPHLASGAGHDGVVMSRVAPVSMLFVRCRDGLSHHPDEFVKDQDVAAAIEVVFRFLKSFLVGG